MVDKNDEFKKKHVNDVFLARGGFIELSTIIEKKLNEILLNIGKKKNLKGMWFKKKAKSVEDLMLELNPEIKGEEFKPLQDFVRLRNIFAHAPIKWDEQKLEFDSEGEYKKFFEGKSEWKDFNYVGEYYSHLVGGVIMLLEKFIIYHNIHKQMKTEINKSVFGKDLFPEMEEKIYRIGNELKQNMEEKRKSLRSERKSGDEFGFGP